MAGHDADIRWRAAKDVDIEGATVIEAVPAAGLPAAIAAGYLIRSLELDHVGGFESDAFPPVSMIWHGKPRSPLRVYARKDPAFAVITSEFTPKPHLFRPIARAILEWTRNANADLVLSPDGVMSKGESYDPENPRVAGAAASDRVRALFEKRELPFLERGMISGVSGMLLNEARDEADVGALLVQVTPDQRRRVHDARAAAVLMEALGRVCKDLDIDTKTLFKEAERAEELLRELRGTAAQAGDEDEISAAYR